MNREPAWQGPAPVLRAHDSSREADTVADNETRETQLAYDERGSGTPLVLLHGFPFDRSIWQAQLDEVGKTARVLAPDLPGFGASPPLAGGEPSIAGYAVQIANWADSVGLRRFALAGHSMGGYIALAFAGAYADRLTGLGLICTRPGPDTEQAREGRYKQIEGVWDRGPQVVVDAMLPRLFSPATREKQPELIDRIREVMLRQTAGGIVAALRAMAGRPDTTRILPNIAVPTLVVSGADDVIIPSQDADLMAAMIPGARQVIIGSAGHLPMLEQPDKLSDVLSDLARGARSTPDIPAPPSPNDIAGIRRHD
jgi:pimeloyl-ACP methyl ester carboxylesterase